MFTGAISQTHSRTNHATGTQRSGYGYLKPKLMTNVTPDNVEAARAALDHMLSEVAAKSAELLAPLKELSSQQKAAVLMLGMLIRDLGLAIQPPTDPKPETLRELKQALNQVLRPLGTIVTSTDPCNQKSIDYAYAVKKCRDAGKLEDECLESQIAAVAALKCRIREIELMRSAIEKLLAHQDSPSPFIWHAA